MPITEARKRMNEKFKGVIREGLTKCLRGHGFRHKGIYYWRDHDPTVACAITVIKASPQYVEPNAVSFSILCGIFVHAFRELFPKHEPNAVPNAFLAQLRADPQHLTPTVGSEFRFDADASPNELASMARTICEVFEDIVLPWYAKFRTAEDVGDYLMAPGKAPGREWISYREIKKSAGSLRDAAIAYFGAGKYDRARELLDLAMETIDRHGKHFTADLRERMERLIAQRQADRAKL